MGYVPADARWFLADLVVEHRIDGDSRNVVHINTVLVNAGSAEEAYSKACALGEGAVCHYENSDGQMVTVSFRGLRGLFVIFDELEHGAELIYGEEIGLTEDQVAELITPKESLAVFRERQQPQGPNFMPDEIMKMLLEGRP